MKTIPAPKIISISGSKSLISSAGTRGFIDPDVKTFTDAVGITDTMEINALSDAVIALKGENAESYDFWSDVVYANFISPTGLTQALRALVPGSGNDPALEISTSAVHSDDGVLFNGTTQAWNLGDTSGNIVRENFFVCMSFSNNATINGRSFGKIIDDGDVAPGDWRRTQCYRQNNSGIMGFLFGSTTGLLDRVGVWTFGNDGTNHAIWRDGIKLVLTITAINTGELTGDEDDFLAARNGNSSGVAGFDNPQDDQVASVITFNASIPYTNAQNAVLASIINTYNTNVV